VPIDSFMRPSGYFAAKMHGGNNEVEVHYKDIEYADTIADTLVLLHDPLKLNGHLPSRKRNQLTPQFFVDSGQGSGFQV
jgi:hypothetical protein